MGISFEGDTKNRDSPNKLRRVYHTESKNRRTYEILHILEFDANRKRMSIIVKDNSSPSSSHQYHLFCKGADSSIFKNCSNVNEADRVAVQKFAHNGWRTLALAYRELTQSEYDQCERRIVDAYNDIMQRNEKMANVYDEIESNMVLLGSTAIEDKLQEDVVDTLETLQEAGIKIWVLTGDKLETAVNISQACGHFTDSMNKLTLTNMNDRESIEKSLNYFAERLIQ